MCFVASLEAGSAFFLADSPSCSSSVTFLLIAALIVSAKEDGDGMAGSGGGDATFPFPTERKIVGAKITDTIARARSNAATMKIARVAGDSPCPDGTVEPVLGPRLFPSRDGGVGLPIVSA